MSRPELEHRSGIPGGSTAAAARILAHLPDMAFVIGPDGIITWASAATRAVLGWDPAEWVGRPVTELVHPDDLVLAASSIASLQTKERGTLVELRVIDADGAWRLVEVVGSRPDDGTDEMICVARDLTERRRWEIGGNDLARVQRIIQHAAALVLLVSPDGRVGSVNAAFGRVLGHDPSAVVGRPLTDFVVAADGPLLEAAFSAATRSPLPTAIEVDLIDRQGRPVVMRLEVNSLMDDPLVHGFVVTGSDITELRTTRRELEHLATHDHLTGLVNRTHLIELLDRHASGPRPRGAIAFIDLDHFKPVNDTFGHETGDAVLVEVAQRLRAAVRPTDVVARVGGDEFVVFAPGPIRRDHQAAFARRLRAAFDQPFALPAAQVLLSASIGCVRVDAASTAQSLLADADEAMYLDKAARRGAALPPSTIEFFARHRLATELEDALDRGQIVPYLEPVVSVATGEIIGVEALARWEHPTLGQIDPSEFLHLVTTMGLDLAFGDTMLDRALAAVAPLPGAPWLAVNLSVTQLVDGELAQRVTAALDRHGVDPSRLYVEITEHAVLSDQPTVGGVVCDEGIARLHALGSRIVLDDFGTGFSSLTHLRRFPLHAIKIDRSFVAGLGVHEADHQVVTGLVDLAHALDLVVVAEGVETSAQRALLAEIGCDHAQGYLFSPAVPVDQIGAVLDRPAVPAISGRRAARRSARR